MQHDIYNIDIQILGCLDTDTGEILDIERLNELNMLRDTKIDNLCLMRKNASADIAGIKSEIDNLNARIDSKNKLIEQLDKWIGEALGGENFKPDSGLYEVKFTHSKSVEAYDMDALLAFDDTGRFIRFGKPEAAKKEIAKALKEGKTIPGCRLIEKTNMSIK